MAKKLVMANDADARVAEQAQAQPMWLMPADVNEPLSERLVQAGSRWAGIASFVVALGAVGLWLLG
ncbi:hypothetical protein FHS95_000905 [Sphingomonas naasensis]|uniref:Uncharacterized protein n=1 Tax=Sphingomonas naasensis TaxID=1344951 RepID=A0A4S1WSL8_9SPHN|nr:hypothetical protein [Sphingomonas naasensis]NIJ19236.1 hypothetical protein [Sphingomonas naasensis]TGX46418.1 hypothetical protein E5A74_04515 [Sphingomonas naasensis]